MFDPSQPQSVVGEPVEVLWAKGKWYRGVVDEYDARSKKWHVSYDDGDKKWYDLRRKTFRVLASGELWDGRAWQEKQQKKKATTYSYNAYHYGYHSQWVPYQPQHPDARLRTRFLAYLPGMAESPEMSMLISGNLACMGGWDLAQAVPMHPSPHNNALWEVELELPFLPGEKWTRGLFEYKFVLEDIEGDRALEGGATRKPKVAHTVYYNAVNGSRRSRLFRGMRPANARHTVLECANVAAAEFSDDPYTLALRLDRLTDSSRSLTKADIETAADAVCAQLQSLGASARSVFAVFTMVGFYGLSSARMSRQQQQDTGYFYYASAPASMPTPREWARFAAALDWKELYARRREMRELLGDAYFQKAMRGLREAAETHRAHGDYAYLPIMTVLNSTLAQVSRPSMRSKRETKRVESAFEAALQGYLSDGVLSVTDGDTDDRTDDRTDDHTDDGDGDDDEKSDHVATASSDDAYAGALAAALTSQAPSLSALTRVLTCLPAGVRADDETVCMRVAAWLQNRPLPRGNGMHGDGDDSDAEALANFVSHFPQAQSVHLVKVLLERKLLRGQLLLKALKAATATCDPQAVVPLIKTYFASTYGRVPRPKQAASGGLYLRAPPKPKVKSPAELHEQRLTLLGRGVAAMREFLTLPCLAEGRFTDTFVFELTRTEFLRNGSPLQIMESLVSFFGSGEAKQRDIVTDALVRHMCALTAEVSNDANVALDVVDMTKRLPKHVVQRVHSSILERRLPDEEPTLHAVLRNAELIEALAEAGTCDLSVCTRVLSKATAALTDGSAKVSEVRALHKRRRILGALLKSVGEKGDDQVLSDAAHSVDEAESALKHLQHFLLVLCSAGAPVDVSELREVTSVLSHGFAETALRELGDAFVAVDRVWPSWREDVAWLHTLRHSHVFTHVWRAVSLEDAGSEGTVLSFERVLHMVLPQVRRRFGELCRAVWRLEMPVPQLRALFSGLSDRSYEGEVRLMRGVTEGGHSDIEIDTEVDEDCKQAEEDQLQEDVVVVDHDPADDDPADDAADDPADEPADEPAGETDGQLGRVLRQLRAFAFVEKVQRWLPGLVQLRTSLGEEFFECSVDKDAYYQSMHAMQTSLLADYETHTLRTVHRVEQPLRKRLRVRMSPTHFDFLVSLAQAPEVTTWLALHTSTRDYNELLEVVRPCTEDPRLLAGLAALTNTRTLLLPLFVDGCMDLLSLLEQFAGFRVRSGELASLEAVAGCWHALLDVFTRQTRSPAVKAAIELRELWRRGSFETGTRALSFVLLEEDTVTKTYTDAWGEELRAQLLMADLEELADSVDPEIGTIVQHFDRQLQAAQHMCRLMKALCEAGHPDYLREYTVRVPFRADSLTLLEGYIQRLEEETEALAELAMQMREEYPVLRHYTIRECVRLVSLCIRPEEELQQQAEEALQRHERRGRRRFRVRDRLEQASSGGANALGRIDHNMSTQSQADREDAVLVPRVRRRKKRNVVKRFFRKLFRRRGSRQEDEAQLSAEEEDDSLSYTSDGTGLSSATASQPVSPGGAVSVDSDNDSDDEDFDKDEVLCALRHVPLLDLANMLAVHNVACAQDVELAARVRQQVRHVLTKLTEDDRAVATETDGSVATETDGDARAARGVVMLRHWLEALGRACASLPEPSLTQVPVPPEGSANRVDVLATAQGTRVFAATTTTPLRTVLSVYVRRGVLPKEGQVLLCDDSTTLEEVTLLLWRCFGDKGSFHEATGTEVILEGGNKAKSDIFVLANVERLSYQLQCRVAEVLRDMASDRNTLLVLARSPGQVLLTALSNAHVTLLPLPDVVLTKSLKHVEGVTGQEGGGKTTFIRTQAAMLQREDRDAEYRVLSLREHSSSADLIDSLILYHARQEAAEAVAAMTRTFLHVDVAHQVSEDADALLFSLVVTKVLRDRDSCRAAAVFAPTMMVEFGGNAQHGEQLVQETQGAQNWSSLLPVALHATVCKERQAERLPVFTDATGLRLGLPMDDDALFVAKYLRAVDQGKLNPESDQFLPEYTPWLDAEITTEEVYDIISEATRSDMDPVPSFATMRTFIQMMQRLLSLADRYPVLGALTQSSEAGDPLRKLRHCVTRLLAATSRDFARRALPRGAQFRADHLLRTTNAPNNNVRLAMQFEQMASWKDGDHPVFLFYGDERTDAVSGMEFIAKYKRVVRRYVDPMLRTQLRDNGIQLVRDWTRMRTAEGAEIVRRVEGFRGLDFQPVQSKADDEHYVITLDNLLKMLSIQLRWKAHAPVLLSGETGCGKSSLIQQLCRYLGYPLRTLNVHGGVDDAHIHMWMNARVQEATSHRHRRFVIFLDEINTCDSLALFKSILIDRMCDGKTLPNNLLFAAACNPYRLRNAALQERQAGVGLANRDPSQLVYRVRPLPGSLLDFVFDFGALAPATERLYIRAMLRRQLSMFVQSEMYIPNTNEDNTDNDNNNDDNNDEDDDDEEEDMENVEMLEQRLLQLRGGRALTSFGQFCAMFAELLCQSQEYVRHVNGGERSVASLRDVSRAVRIYRWFAHLLHRQGADWTIEQFFAAERDARDDVRRAVMLSIHFCYASRLRRDERVELVRKLSKVFDGYAGRLYRKATWLRFSPALFGDTTREVQLSLVRHMSLPRGVALNEALLENVFCCVVAILNRMPIFVVGKPGSSKSLALSLIQSTFNGPASDCAFYRNFPNVEVFSYQCSPLSTSAGIEHVFEAARRYQKQAGKDTVATVLLDEIGLAEQSPHLPLKVLHKLFDEHAGTQAVVGISNWALDSSKMNRAIHLCRPRPTVEDLTFTAEGIVGDECDSLRPHLAALAQAYDEVYTTQRQADFFGLRDFYGLVRHLHTRKQNLTREFVLEAVQRNFGGRARAESRRIEQVFLRHLALGHPLANQDSEANVLQLVRQNLSSVLSRHLMLLTRNDAALALLHDLGALKNADVFHGSDFALDKSHAHICAQLQKLKLAMADDSGRTVVLVHCEAMFESLYDLFNQHYTRYGGQSYVRVAFGHSSRLCPISEGFRVIVVVERTDAYTRLAPPLLNRFEKQVLDRRTLLRRDEAQKRLYARLVDFAQRLARAALQLPSTDEKDTVPMPKMRAVFNGFHGDMCVSLVQSVCTEFKGEAALRECVVRLLRVVSVEAMCALVQPSQQSFVQQALEAVHSSDIELRDFFFGTAMHTSLVGLLSSPEQTSHTLVLTYAPRHLSLRSLIGQENGSDEGDKTTTRVIALHELQAQRDFEDALVDFAAESPEGTLVVEADLSRCSARRVRHAQHLLSSTNTSTARVVLLVHLPRQHEFAADFDSRWRLVAVDAVASAESAASALPPLHALVSHEDSDALMQQVDVGVLMRQHFRRALTLVVGKGNNSAESLRERISLLMYCLSAESVERDEDTDMHEDESEHADFLLRGFRRQFLRILAADDGRLRQHLLDVGSIVQQRKRLLESSTLQHAISRGFSRVVVRILARLLAHCDRDGGLRLLHHALCNCTGDCKCEAPGFRRLWSQLLRVSFAPHRRALLANGNADEEADGDSESSGGGTDESDAAESDGVQHNEHFPFARATWRLLQSLRPTADAAAAVDVEASETARVHAMAEALRAQLALLQLTELQGDVAGKMAPLLWLDASALHLSQHHANAVTAPDSDSDISHDTVIYRWLQRLCRHRDFGLLDVATCACLWWRRQSQLRALSNLLQQLPRNEVDLEGWLVLAEEEERDTVVALALVHSVCDAASKKGSQCLRRFDALRPLLLAVLEACDADGAVLVDRYSVLAHFFAQFDGVIDRMNETFNGMRSVLCAALSNPVAVLNGALGVLQMCRANGGDAARARACLRRLLRHLLMYGDNNAAVCARALELSSDMKFRYLLPDVSSCAALLRLVHAHCDNADDIVLHQLQVEFERDESKFELSSLACAYVALSDNDKAQCYLSPSNAREALSTAISAQSILTRCAALCVNQGDQAELAEKLELMDALLLKSRAARMLFVREMASQGGISAVRRTLARHPLISDSLWLRQWCQQEAPLKYFLGTGEESVLPRHNAMQCLPQWSETYRNIQLAMSGDLEALNQMEPSVGAVAFWHEWTTMRGAQDMLRQESVRLMVAAESAVRQHAALGAMWKRLCTPLARVTKSSTQKNISMARVIVHMSALEFFRPLMQVLEQPSDYYLPCQPEDATAMAIRALGGRWYKCPNGHSYYVDRCGRPTEILRCSECGAKIGGTNHNLLGNNQDVDTNLAGNTNYHQRSAASDQSPKGYALPSLQEERQSGNHLSARGLPPVSYRVMRILLHSLMCLQYKDQDISLTQLRLEDDWEVLHKLTGLSYEDLGLRVQHLLCGLKDCNASFATLSDRAAWEQHVSAQVTAAMSKTTAADLLVKYAPREDDLGGVFAAELTRRQAESTVYAVRRRASVEDLRRRLTLLPQERRDQLRLLARFCDELEQLTALPHLPSARAFLRTMHERHDRRISKVEARETKLGDVITDARTHVQFEGFCQAWNAIWPHVDRFGCLELPRVYKALHMDASAAVSLTLPSEKDEGICPLMAMRAVVELHNEYVGMAREFVPSTAPVDTVSSRHITRLMALRDDAVSEFRAHVADSFFGTDEWNEEALEQLQRRVATVFVCLPLVDLELPTVTYAYRSAQGKDQSGSSDNVADGNEGDTAAAQEALLGRLSRQIAQRPASSQLLETVKRVVTAPCVAQLLLERLHTVVSFVVSTADAGVQIADTAADGSVLLSDFAKQILRHTEQETAQQEVWKVTHLNNVRALAQLLRRYVRVDVFAAVRPKYRDPLPPSMEQEVRASAASLDCAVLLPTLRSFIVTHLREDTYDASEGLKTLTSYLDADEEFLCDLPWFEHMPESPRLKHILSFYETLCACVSAHDTPSQTPGQRIDSF